MKLTAYAMTGVCFQLLACSEEIEENPSRGKVTVQSKFLRAAEPVNEQYIVVLNANTAGQAARTLAESLVSKYGGELGIVYEHALVGFSVKMNEAQALALAGDAAVQYIQEDNQTSIAVTQTNPVWGLDRIDSKDKERNYAYSYIPEAGAGVHVYVMDTGVRTTHSEFLGRMGNGANFVADGNSTYEDCHGHGTHVAATIAGTTYGAAKKAIIHPLRAQDCKGGGPDSMVLAAIDWVFANHQKPAVVNMSLYTANLPAIEAAIRASIANGIVYVYSAGNDSGDACVKTPSRVAEGITVGATDSSDTKAGFSNDGSCVDIFAPGVGIVSAGHRSDTDVATMSGTSMSTPYVSGVVALMLSQNPTATPAQIQQTLINNASVGFIKAFSRPTPNRLLRTPALPTPDCTVSVTQTASGAEPAYTLTWTGPASDSCTYSVGNVPAGQVSCNGSAVLTGQVPGIQSYTLMPPNYAGTGECSVAYRVLPACEVTISPSTGSVSANTVFTVTWKSDGAFCGYSKNGRSLGAVACSGSTTTTAAFFGAGSHTLGLRSAAEFGFNSFCDSNEITVGL